MNISQIELAISQKASAASTDYELLVYAKALQILKTGTVFVVNTYSALPSAVSNEGKLYFVEDIETVLWSNGLYWLRLLDKEAQRTELYSWGSGICGRLGDGTTVSSCSPVREISSSTDWCQVSAGNCHSSAVKITGQIWSWGGNTCGRLGDGTTVDKCSPIREISSSTDWCSVSTGVFHTTAIKTSGQIWSWGSNVCGRLGDGTTLPKCSPVREISSATDWCQVSAGCLNTAAIKTSGQIWVWGNGSCGVLGNGTTVNTCSPVREFCSATDWCQVSAGVFNTLAINTSGQIWSWGYNRCGQLGDGTTVDKCSPVREITSSTDWCQVRACIAHNSAIKTSGQIWSWGRNLCGSLGDGTTLPKCSPVREVSLSTDWCQVSAGSANTSAIKTAGQLWSWGSNVSGRLGDGTTVDKCSPVREITSSTNWCQTSSVYHTAALKVV